MDRSTDHKDSRSLNQSKRFNAEAHIEQVFDINDNHIFINSRANSQADNDHSPDCSDPEESDSVTSFNNFVNYCYED